MRGRKSPRRARTRMVPRDTGRFHPVNAMNCIASILPGSLLRTLSFHSGVIFSALLIILVLGVFLWAAFFRKPARRKASRHHWKPKVAVETGNGVGSPPVRTPRRRHKRRRPRQPLNPTLAQTHGLPPVRDKQSTPPPAY